MLTHLPPLVLFAVGASGLLNALARLARMVRAKRGLARALGTVVEVEPVEHLTPHIEGAASWWSSWTRYRPIVEFTTATGEVRRCAGLHSLPERAVTAGKPLPVRYDPEVPNVAFLDTYAEGLGTLSIPALVGVGCLWFGMIAWSL
jgi:hypothetical protein